MKRMNFNLLLMASAIFSVILITGCEKEKYIYESGNLVPNTVDLDPSLSSIIVNGAMLHSEAFGNPDSTIIVCIHGGPGGDYRYLLNCKDLADHGYRVVFYDQRGSGLSQRFPKKFYTDLGEGAIDLMYNELSGVIAHYRTSPGQKVFLVGHSWGAMLATAYAGKYPNAIQGLAVCEPGGLKWDDVIEFVKTSRSFELFGEILNDATYLDQFITGKEDQHEILDYKVTMMASKNEITEGESSSPVSIWRRGAVINIALFELGEIYTPDFSEGISNFNVPVLFFYSEKDQAYLDSWAQKISAVYNTADVFKITGVGHDGIIQDKGAWTNQTLPKMLAYFNSL
jgi:proline iminopeptidase